MFVATINGVPVGISHLSVDKTGEVWLSAARTDLNYRRMGVATAITRKCLEYAKKKGARKTNSRRIKRIRYIFLDRQSSSILKTIFMNAT